MAEEPTIIYSVKELISRLDGKLDAMMNLMTNKADRSDVTALEHRLDNAEHKVSSLETREKQRDQQQGDHTLKKRWVIGIWLAIATSVVGAAISLLGILLHK